MSTLHFRFRIPAAAMLAFVLATPVSRLPAETVAYYRFETGAAGSTATGAGSILDSSGHGLNGTPVDGPVYRSDVPVNPIPQTGSANTRSLDFNGSSAFVAIADDPRFALTRSLTIEAFIQPRTGGVADYNQGQIFFRGDDRGGLDPYFLGLYHNSIEFVVEDESYGYAALYAPIPALNIWMHVAGTLDDATGAMHLWVNGVSVASTVTNIRPFAVLNGPNPGLGIGNVQAANLHETFNGLIDEVRLSDVALQPSQFLNASPVPEIDPAGIGTVIALVGGAIGLVERRRREARPL